MGGEVRKVDIGEAKTDLAKLVRAALEGEDVVISRHGKPVVRLVPFLAPEGVRPIGLHRLPPDIATEDFVDNSMRPVDERETSEWTTDLVPHDEAP